MKKFLFAVALMTATALSAQNSISIRGGVNWRGISVENRGTVNEVRSFDFVGFNIGLHTSHRLSTHSQWHTSIQSGILLTTKGQSREMSVAGETPIYAHNLMYLQVPIHFAYIIEPLARFGTRPIRIIFNAGPYLAYGIGGSLEINGERLDGHRVFGNDIDQLKPFDFGFTIGLGVETGRVFAGFSRDMGIANISNINNDRYRNRVSSFTMGYRF